MNTIRTYIGYGLLTLALCAFIGCSNPFEPPKRQSGDTKTALVRIYIGESGVRTIQPVRDEVAGYQLTFGPGTHAPVNITEGNYTDVTLANGNWTITATAYRKGGVIGVSNDAVASGSISISLPGDTVSGNIPPIILKPAAGTGSGTLHYDITVDSGVSGYVKLWEINGTNLISTFADAGVLNLTGSVNNNFTHTAGRYIIEAKLTNEIGNIAFRREVIEIWKNTTTAFMFAPVEYLDPNTVEVANSRARLSETDTMINSEAIGSGTGNGSNEQNPKTYTFSAADAGNVSITLVFETDSLFAAVGWAATAGTVPDTYSAAALPAVTDFSTNNILWIKTVSEDRSETMYYRFIIIPPPANYGAFKVSASNPAGVSYTLPNLTISQNGTYIISMRDGVTSTTINKIVVASRVNADITLSGVQIDVSGTDYYCAFDMTGATVNLTLVGENILKSGLNRAGLQVPAEENTSYMPVKATLFITEASTGSLEAKGGFGSAGIGGRVSSHGVVVSPPTVTIYGQTGGVININGGTITATGGSYGAGIGGAQGGNGGTISINGGMVTAIGGNDSAGIGGGQREYLGSGIYAGGAGGTVTINGGTVTATGGSYGIGGGYSGTSGTIIIRNTVLFASIQSALTEGGNVNNAIVFNRDYGTIYGNVSLDKDITIPSGKKLVVKNGQTLIIKSGYTLTNNGTIWLEGNIEGTIAGNPPVQPAFTVSGGSAYTYVTSSTFSERVLTITGDGTYTIGMKNGITGTTTDRIVVEPYVNADIILSGINIDVSGTYDACAFNLSNAATINLTLAGTTILKSGSNRAGLQAPAGATLVITAASTGSLEATGGSNGAGIGGGSSGAGGTITINGSTVTATGGNRGAGIGGGGSSNNAGAGGTITINDGMVTATGNGNGAGIGGGARDNSSAVGSSGSINIGNNAVIIASSIQPTLTEGGNVNNALVLIGNTGTMYGNVTLNRNVTISSGKTLDIKNGQSLIIQDGYTLTNNGSIWINGGGNIEGTIAGNPPMWPSFLISGDSGYTYISNSTRTERVLTITGDGTYTIGMRNGITGTTTDRIVVASKANAAITLSGVNIDVSGTDNTCAFDMTGATVNITLAGTNVLKSGSNRAGLQAPAGATLVIAATNADTFEITGGAKGAGIGGGNNNAGGTITINGGMMTITGGANGAGIGGGYYGSGGTITINGSTVTASGGSYAAGIGGGYHSDGGSINISGNAVIFASSIQSTLTEGVNVNNALVFIGNSATIYGNVALAQNITISADQKLGIKHGGNFIIKDGYTLTNNGIIWVDGGGNIEGTIAGNPPIWPSFTVSGNSEYTYMSNAAFTERVLTITGDGNYTIGMRNDVTSTTTDRIVVRWVKAAITLSNVNIDVSSSETCAFDMTIGATVNLTLAGTNILKSGFRQAGLQAPAFSSLVITAASTGSLEAIGGYYGAGIGGGYSGAGGTIAINGGTVTATSGHYSAGIGGGMDGAGGTITINGGTVTASASIAIGTIGSGAGIGGGSSGAGGTITINGGTVIASGGSSGAGIGGGGSSGAGGTITINGGTVIASGGSYDETSRGAGIGGGDYGTGGTVTINGGTVTATGGPNGAGIGSGRSNGSINISINNAVLFASSIQPTLTEGNNVSDSIVFQGNTGTLYGNVTLAQDVTFATGRVLTIRNGKSLTIPDSITLTNNGTINNNGTITVEAGGVIAGTGSVTGNQPVYQ